MDWEIAYSRGRSGPPDWPGRGSHSATMRKMQPKTDKFRSTAIFLALLGAGLANMGAAPARNAPDQTAMASTGPAASGTIDTGMGDANSDGVAAVVNDTIISEYDLRQRIALFLATSGINPTPDQMKRIRAQVLTQLETERLELAEAQKNNTTISSADVDNALNNIIQSNHLTMDQLKAVLARYNVDVATLRAQIATQLAWEKTVDDQFGDRVHVTPEDVDAELKRLAQGANKPHFLVAEIFLAVDRPDRESEVQKTVQDIETQLQAGAPFGEVARQFSQSPSAAQGGNIGVVEDGQLAPELNDALEKLKPGQFSAPIRSAGGFYILELVGRQEPMGTKVPDAASVDAHPSVLPLARILLPLGGKPSAEFQQKALHAGEVIRSHIGTCDTLPALVKQLPGAVLMKLGDMKLADLSQEIQNALANTQPGEAAPPFISSAGVEIIVRCDPPVPQVTAFKMPTRDEVEQQLFEEQISTLARQYLSDLRREADVETR